MMKTLIPPIKSQGIKAKLVDWIKGVSKKVAFERWVEPFMGTGVVLLISSLKERCCAIAIRI